MKLKDAAELKQIIAWFNTPSHRMLGEAGAAGAQKWRVTVAVSLTEECERLGVNPPKWLLESVETGKKNQKCH